MAGNRIRLSVFVFCAAVVAAFPAVSSRAAIVWDLNPGHQNAPVGSSNRTYTSSGYSITAYGFDNHAGVGTAHDLFYKNVAPINGSVEMGLGLVNTPNNEMQANLHFIQFDFTAALAAGLFNGEISVVSVQPGETFSIFGSNALGALGTQVGGTFDSTVDNQFVPIPNFGQFNFYSIMATADDVLPVAIRAGVPAIPEMNALLPIAALLVLLLATNVWHRRSSA
ncbi:MAG TPA: hypothetical protein VLO30_02385 [Chthoniobacterales bacterium]|nr:hypothetical protein [Chthoniobacterales bacterium]